jgi:RNA polymerase sigma-70 factor, ECF subfamily
MRTAAEREMRERGRSEDMPIPPPGSSSLTDLVKAAQEGSAVAFEELVRRLGPQIYRFLVVRLRSESDARDALQETLIVAWQRLPQLLEPQSCRSWLLTIAVRKAAQVRRRRGNEVALDGQASPVRDPDIRLELEEALSALSPEMRDVILLRYLVGLSEEETAATLRVRLGTVKSRASRARRLLAQFLDVTQGNERGDQR